MSAAAEGCRRRFDVAIVGAGPAGLAAAEVLRQYELRTAVIDEQPRAGGQILRQPPEDFRVDDWMSARLYKDVRALLQSVSNEPRIDWLFGTSVHGINRFPEASCRRGSGRFELCLQSQDGLEIASADVVLLASGCYETPLALPGWILPGVMGAGAIQAFVKSQQFVPGNRFLLAGSHPLQLVVADQLVKAGANVAAVLFTQRLRDAFGLFRSPLAMLQAAPQLAETARILSRLRRAGVAVRFGQTITGIDGDGAVERATIAPLAADGRFDASDTERIQCDRVGLCHGFSASSELARQAGAETRYRPHDGGWLVVHDPWFESSVADLFVAGEITGLAGADASLHKGRIAALGALYRLERIGSAEAEQRARSSRRRLRTYERFANVLNRLSRPPASLAQSLATDDTVLCRCESVTCGSLQRALAEHAHIRDVNAAKLATRVGMGLCQGRYCGGQVMQLVAEARGLPIDEVGAFRMHFPAKPLNIGLMRK